MQNYHRSKVKIISVLVLCLFYGNKIVVAQDEALTPTLTPAINQEKTKEIREAVKERVKEKMIAGGQIRGYAGIIGKLSETELKIETNKGDKNVTLTNETKIVKKEQLKEGAYIIVIGKTTTEDGLEAKRIVVAQKPKTREKVVAAGKVIDISPEEQLLTVKNEKSGEVVTVEIKEEKQFVQIKTGDWLIAIGIPAENDKKMLTAKTVLTKPEI